MKYKENWWAHQDLNLGPIDYEQVEIGLTGVGKLKKLNDFRKLHLFSLAETELFPNWNTIRSPIGWSYVEES